MSSNPAGTIGRINNWKTTRDALVIEEGFNVRFDMGELEQLADSVASLGIKRALLVQRTDGGKFVVRDGHRRLSAVDIAIKAGKIDAQTFEIPIQIEDKSLSPAEVLALMAIANDGKPLLPLEEATLYKRLTDEGKTLKEVCALVGRGDAHVWHRMALLTAAPEVVEAVKAGTVRATLAQQIVSAARKDHGKQRELLAQAAKGGDAKKAVREVVDTDAKKKKALRMKVDEIKDTLADVSSQLVALLAASKFGTRATLKEKVGDEAYKLITLIGQESALRKLVRGAEAAAE